MKKFDFMKEPRPTGRHCELCNVAETQYFPLINFYLDRNPANDRDENIARVCSCCYRHLLLAMPTGIGSSLTLFAFLINRKLYTSEQLRGTPDNYYPEKRVSPRPKQLSL